MLETLHQARVPVDYIAGTSVGSAVAGLYALGREPAQVADILDEFGPNLFKLHFPLRSLLSNRGMRRYMQVAAPDERIEDLETPLAIVAADILNQREVVFQRGLLWQAVLTSISIPGIYPASRSAARCSSTAASSIPCRRTPPRGWAQVSSSR